MLLLILILAMFAAVPLIVILLIQQSVLRQGNSEENLFSAFNIDQAFDLDHALIWDTQVPALQLAASAGEKGVPLEGLRMFYDRSRRQYPELYDGSSFGSWLEFLQRAQLIGVDRGRASLRAEGLEFLRCRVATELAKWAIEDAPN